MTPTRRQYEDDYFFLRQYVRGESEYQELRKLFVNWPPKWLQTGIKNDPDFQKLGQALKKIPAKAKALRTIAKKAPLAGGAGFLGACAAERSARQS